MLRISSGIDHFEGDARVLLTQACDVLSQLTGAMAVAVTPYFPAAVISNVQLLPIGKRSAVVVFSTSAGVFRSKIAKLHTDADYELYELFYNVCAANFVGSACTALTRADLQRAVLSLGARALDVAPLLVSLFEAISECAEADVIARGQSALLSSELAADAPKIIELTANKDAIVRLLRENVSGEPKIRIGAENGYPFMRSAAVLTSPYSAGGAEAGAIAVIGSVKTDYAHVLPLVKYVSDVIGTLLSGEPDTTQRKD
jgi:heat-inducible transcriptional repressor